MPAAAVDSSDDEGGPSLDNLWTAASDGDLERVKQLVEGEGAAPDAPDESSYTALHAAASWARPDVLRWLVSKGGNMNVADSDGDTPLFACETREMAELCVELGADPLHRNHDGFSAAQTHDADAPHISAYLRGITGEPEPDPSERTEAPPIPESDDAAASTLLEQVQAILAKADLDGTDPEPLIRAAIAEVVDSRVTVGREVGEAEAAAEAAQNAAEAGPAKRARPSGDGPER